MADQNNDQSQPVNQPAPGPAQPQMAAHIQLAAPAQAVPPEAIYSIPVNVPESFMQQLISLQSESGLKLSDFCFGLMQRAVNADLLDKGTINDISEEAQDIFRTVSIEAGLEALRIYNVAKSPVVPAENGNSDIVLSEGDILFSTTSDVKDYIAQINAHRIKKGLAPLEKSICELLYHYGLTLGDYQLCQEVTGMSYNKFVAVFKTLGLNEREQNGAQSNLIDTGRFLGKFDVVDTPNAVLPAPIASPPTASPAAAPASQNR